MMRAPWATHFGFTKLPFSKSISAKDLLDRTSNQEAVARIRFCRAEALLGVITGEVGVGNNFTAAVGTRGLYVKIVRALGAAERVCKLGLVAQTQNLLTAAGLGRL